MSDPKKRAYFIISEGSSVFSKLIEWYQRGLTYTHTSIVLNKENIFDPEVVSAVTTVKRGLFSQVHTGIAKQKRWKYYYVEVTQNQLKKYKAFAEKAVNKSYDIKGILGFLLRSNTNDPNKFFCTELYYRAMELSGEKLLNNTQAYEATVELILRSFKVLEDKSLNQKLVKHFGW